jgi:hypothetical protein
VINTLKPDFFPENISGLMRAKKDMDAEKHKTFIDVDPAILNLIQNS